MKVIWRGSQELQDGTEKITLGIPVGAEDELYAIKKAVKRGETICLVTVAADIVEKHQEEGIDDLIEIIRDYGLRRFEEGRRIANENNLIISPKYTSGGVTEYRDQEITEELEKPDASKENV